jgi:hypothetical protein
MVIFLFYKQKAIKKNIINKLEKALLCKAFSSL